MNALFLLFWCHKNSPIKESVSVQASPFMQRMKQRLHSCTEIKSLFDFGKHTPSPLGDWVKIGDMFSGRKTHTIAADEDTATPAGVAE